MRSVKIKDSDTLLMFSGGLDSVGALWQLIQESKKIHIHHMNLKNIENRFLAEHYAIRKILEYIKPICDFTYSESTHEYPVFNTNFLWDGDLSSFMAGNICASAPSIKYVAFGRTATDDERSEVSSRIAKANQIFKALCDAEKIYPVQHLTKDQIYKMLPQELFQFCWSCRRPIYKPTEINPCLRCTTCLKMKELKIPHSRIQINVK